MKKLIFLFAFSAFITAGCSDGGDDPIDEPKPEPDRQVVIFFKTKSLTDNTLSPSATEDDIQKIILFGVDDQSKVEKLSVTGSPSSSGVTLTVSDKIKSLYAIANPTTSLETASPSTLSDLTALTGEFTSAPQSPFLMSGIANTISQTVTIEFVRAVAKIRIIGENGFQITSIAVMNTSSKGYVFQKTPFSVPDEKRDYTSLTAPTFYVAENTTVSPTKFVVSGQLDGKRVDYPIELTNNGATPVNIVRNNCYEVIVTPPETGNDCSVTVTILDWNDMPIDEYIIPDE